MILTTRYSTRNPYKWFWGEQPNYIGNFKKCREVRIVKNLIKGNMVYNRKYIRVFVGYTEDHRKDNYLIMNLKTQKTDNG